MRPAGARSLLLRVTQPAPGKSKQDGAADAQRAILRFLETSARPVLIGSLNDLRDSTPDDLQRLHGEVHRATGNGHLHPEDQPDGET